MALGDLETIARLAARGDARAFESLCLALQDDVWRYCCALLDDRELAREAAQETFARAVGAIRRFHGDAPVRLWLLVLARRSSAAVLRRECRHRDARAHGIEPDRPLSDHCGAVDLVELVNALPPDQRQAFTLTQVLGLSYREAAAVSGCAVGTIRSRVFRSRERLIAALADDGNQRGEGVQ